MFAWVDFPTRDQATAARIQRAILRPARERRVEIFNEWLQVRADYLRTLHRAWRSISGTPGRPSPGTFGGLVMDPEATGMSESIDRVFVHFLAAMGTPRRTNDGNINTNGQIDVLPC